jgi:hypothetical protein
MYAGGGALRDGRSAAMAEPAMVAVATERAVAQLVDDRITSCEAKIGQFQPP